MESRSIDHPLMKARSQRRVGSSLEEEAQGHQMDADRLDRSWIVAVRMLHGVRVDDELVEGHASRVRVLNSEQVAVAHPTGGRAGHVRMLWCFERRQSHVAAWASRFKAVRRHKTILPNGLPRPRDLTPEHIGIGLRTGQDQDLKRGQ